VRAMSRGVQFADAAKKDCEFFFQNDNSVVVTMPTRKFLPKNKYTISSVDASNVST